MRAVKPKPPLRLFVWEGFSPDYTGGLAFAIARDETDARKMIVKRHGYDPSEWGGLTIYPIKRIARCISGGS